MSGLKISLNCLLMSNILIPLKLKFIVFTVVNYIHYVNA